MWTGGDPGAIATLSISGTASFGQGGGTPFSTGQGCSDPIIGGGGALVYPSIHSPNFVTGSTGWSINKSGTAEFNSLTVRNGTIISGVFLLYSSATPAKGNLVVAFAPIAGGTDSVGNVYPQGFNFGVWSASGALDQHFGIDTSGKLYLADSSGLTRIFLDPSLAAQLIYDSSGVSLGHLIASVASAGGTDSAGNTFKAGVTAYVPATNTWAVNLGSLLSSNPALTFQNLTNPLSVPPHAAGVGSTALGAELSLASGQAAAGGTPVTVSLQDSLFSGLANGLLNVVAGVVNLATSFAQIIVDTWHTVGAAGQPAFVNSFTAGGTAPRFQYEPINGGRVRMDGAVDTGANTVAGTTIFTLPAGYVPSRQLGFVTANNVTAYVAGEASIQVTTGGAVQLVPAGTAGKFVLLDGIDFALD